ncbi:MAG: alpha/beta hydrolase [Cyclobacteriaceae bacterium]|nr:alpha/beta hydrolase [Cyclobacteriaceae bacterium]
MQIHSTCSFKTPEDSKYFENWVVRLEKVNNKKYGRIDLETSLGKTVVWSLSGDKKDLKPLVIFPGFRTCSLFWDFDNALEPLQKNYRIFLVDTNGQPSLSDGNTPDIKSNDYGLWASEVITKLGLTKAVVAGASFGGLVCMKLCIVAPEKVEKAIMLNPGCLQPFSLSLKNLYYNMLPILFPSRKNVKTFLDAAVFCKPNHQLSTDSEELILDYEMMALTRFIDKAQKPYQMPLSELSKVSSDVYLLEGENDLLFPYQKSIDHATKCIKNLKEVFVLKQTGHGIETSKEAISIIGRIMNT